MARIADEQPKPTIKDRIAATTDAVKGKPGLEQHLPARPIFRKGYTDSPATAAT